ncbi:MAG TPA: TetR family transcriptional regulator C-terminal domain-containing protein [Solirubrobacteraceae bacterium]|jgi:AcrR family transcriptional regulator|nr:TetR family transcriptional regulator C-terminal domain-containing protein [Solirubrobacteraceae bacterium]
MPKVVDHEQRRRELGEAVWRVIRRDGVDGASVRRVAQEGGCSAGSLRHYFATQTELLAFAMQLVVDRIERRLAALALPDDPRHAVELVLYELLPLDDDARAENEVWVAFAGRALTDPELRARHLQIDDALRGVCDSVLARLAAGGRVRAGIDMAVEAERLHAVLDGLALHTAMRPSMLPRDRIVAVLTRHLDTLDPALSA